MFGSETTQASMVAAMLQHEAVLAGSPPLGLYINCLKAVNSVFSLLSLLALYRSRPRNLSALAFAALPCTTC
jgi:hypothetical protein